MSAALIAITGRSGSGKSVVSEYYQDLGFEVCDCDKVAREVLQPPSLCLQQLAERFGKDIFDEQNNLNRRLLADRAFATPQGTQDLTDITHPEIIRRILAACESAKQPLFFANGAVIVGHRLEQFCKKIILVQTTDQTAVERICRRDGISPEMAQRRLDAQTKVEILRKKADYIIDNNGSKQVLLQQAKEVLDKLTDRQGVL